MKSDGFKKKINNISRNRLSMAYKRMEQKGNKS